MLVLHNLQQKTISITNCRSFPRQIPRQLSLRIPPQSALWPPSRPCSSDLATCCSERWRTSLPSSMDPSPAWLRWMKRDGFWSAYPVSRRIMGSSIKYWLWNQQYHGSRKLIVCPQPQPIYYLVQCFIPPMIGWIECLVWDTSTVGCWSRSCHGFSLQSVPCLQGRICVSSEKGRKEGKKEGRKGVWN